jgi:hypothetical protein
MTTLTNTGITVELSLPLKQAKQIASLAVFTGRERDTYTPALSVISVRITNGKITAYATDRYCIGKLELATDQELSAEFYLSLDSVKFINGISNTYKAYNVSLTIDDGDITIGFLGNSFSERMFAGKYPAVENLWDNLVAGPVSELALKPDFIGKLAKLIGDDGKKLDGSWRFKFHADPETKKPKPVLATNSCYEVLIQPAMLPA